MKVVFVTASASRQAGGLLGSIQPLAKNIALLEGVTSSVFALDDKFATSDLPGWRPLVPSIFPVRGPRAFGYGVGMASALAAQNADIVHSHGLWMFPSIAVNRYGQHTNKPYVITPHGMLDPWALANSVWKKRLAGILYETRNMRAAACIHALCDAETDAIRSYGLTNPVCRIPNGIDIPSQGEEYAQPPWTGKIPQGKKVLLYLGRIHPKKGLKHLLTAWTKVRATTAKSTCDWVLVIAGWDQGSHEAELKEQANEAGIKNDVLFIGPQFNEAKAACYKHADAFVLPSLSEGFPMVILEAWAYGLPVIMTSQCNIPEGFAAGAAIQIKPNPEEIARGLGYFWEMSESERLEMGNNGFALVNSRFTWDKVAVEMKSVYEWVLGGGKPPSCVSTD